MRRAPRGVCVALAVVALGALGSCAEVLGLEEASVDPEYGASAAPDPTCRVASSIDLDLVASCVLAISCDPLAPEQSISDCITFAALPVPCTAGARNCDSVRACTGARREDLSVCSGGESGWRCEQDVAIRCLAAGAYSVDCAVLGGSCQVSASDDPEPPCVLAEPASCSDAPDDQHCSGDLRYACVDGVAYGVDCDALSLECHEDVPGEALCEPVSPTCAEPDTVSCSGGSIESCGPNSRLTALDCSRAGGTCDASGSDSADCLSPDCTANDVAACVEECADAATLRLCIGGAPYEIDCRTYDMTNCITFTDRESGQQRVSCR